eukprot:732693_1
MERERWGKLSLKQQPSKAELPESLFLDGDIIRLGRKTSESDIVISHKKISSTHAIFFRIDEFNYNITDCSSNGTLLNGHLLQKGGQPSALSDGDVITFASEIKYSFSVVNSVEPDTSNKNVTIEFNSVGLSHEQMSQISFLSSSEKFALTDILRPNSGRVRYVETAAVFLEMLVDKDLKKLKDIPEIVESFSKNIHEFRQHTLKNVSKLLESFGGRRSLLGGDLGCSLSFRNIMFMLDGPGPVFEGRRKVAIQRIQSSEDMDTLNNDFPDCDVRVAYWLTEGTLQHPDVWCVAATLDDPKDVKTLRTLFKSLQKEKEERLHTPRGSAANPVDLYDADVAIKQRISESSRSYKVRKVSTLEAPLADIYMDETESSGSSACSNEAKLSDINFEVELSLIIRNDVRKRVDFITRLPTVIITESLTYLLFSELYALKPVCRAAVQLVEGTLPLLRAAYMPEKRGFVKALEYALDSGKLARVREIGTIPKQPKATVTVVSSEEVGVNERNLFDYGPFYRKSK